MVDRNWKGCDEEHSQTSDIDESKDDDSVELADILIRNDSTDDGSNVTPELCKS